MSSAVFHIVFITCTISHSWRIWLDKAIRAHINSILHSHPHMNSRKSPGFREIARTRKIDSTTEKKRTPTSDIFPVQEDGWHYSKSTLKVRTCARTTYKLRVYVLCCWVEFNEFAVGTISALDVFEFADLLLCFTACKAVASSVFLIHSMKCFTTQYCILYHRTFQFNNSAIDLLINVRVVRSIDMQACKFLRLT